MRPDKNLDIAVVGGGLSGCIAALEIAESGHNVTVFESEPELLVSTSLWCEGKIHLGFVYAADQTGRTVNRMIEGARTFRQILNRYIPSTILERSLSSPYVYALHRDSQLHVDQIRTHYTFVQQQLESVAQGVLKANDIPLWRELKEGEVAGMFDLSEVSHAFQTSEVAVDSLMVLPELRKAVLEHCRINVRCDERVNSIQVVSTKSSQILVNSLGGKTLFRGLVNASWSERRHLDLTAGISGGSPEMHRFKLGLFGRKFSSSVPSVTFVLGPFGDVVNFEKRSYMSWYPACMIARHHDLLPSPVSEMMRRVERVRIREETVQAICQLMPSFSEPIRMASENADVEAGWITACGSSEITDPDSELHQRYDIGVTSHNNVVSIGTGKFTTAPMFGVEAAQLALQLVA